MLVDAPSPAAAPTRIVEVNGTEIVTYIVSPEELGVRGGHGVLPPGGTPQENALLARAVLDGEPGGARELALVNAGAAIYAAGGVETLREGVDAARAAVDSGAAAAALERFVQATLAAAWSKRCVYDTMASSPRARTSSRMPVTRSRISRGGSQPPAKSGASAAASDAAVKITL